MDDPLISTRQVAAILGVNPASVVNWANEGRFPAIQYESTGRSGIYRFRRSDILAYLERSRLAVEPSTAPSITE